MQEDLLQWEDSTLHYTYSVRGEQPVICFHGYGEDATRFHFLETALPASYSLFCINLPFHGATQWPGKKMLTPDTLILIIRRILQQHFNTVYPGNPPWILAGYSMGGRVALSIYEHIPEQVGKLVLLAPDGLKVNFWYWLATQTRPGNHFFAFTMKHPQWFFGLVKLMNKTGLVNASIFKFTNYYIGDPVVRQQLYDRWTTLRKFKPNLSRIKMEINKHHTQIRLLYGIHDRIILSSVGKKFCRGIESNSQLTEIHAGHQVLHEKHAKEILPAFLQ